MHAMQSSASEHSYAHHSGSQNFNFHSVAKPRLSDALKCLLCKPSDHQAAAAIGSEAATIVLPPRRHFAVADLGCSYGRNTLDCAEFVVRTLLEILASSSEESAPPCEIQYYFSDLPSNDFNFLFQSLKPYLYQSDSDTDDRRPKFFAAGVPGSFFGRLFPKASLDLAICSHSLHWLSQVPPSLVDKTSVAWNGGRTWIGKARPSTAVANAYAQQSEMDVKSFLRNRAQELTRGGVLFLLWSSGSRGNPEEESTPFEDALDFMDDAWKEMVDEGQITLEDMDMFNLMIYFPNEQTLESALKDVQELRVLHMESIKNMPTFAKQGDRTQTVEQWIGMLASAIKPGVEAHVGKNKANELFKKLKMICLNQDCFHARLTHTAIIAYLQRV